VSGRVVLAGGGGLLGRALTRDLLASGHEVLVLSRNPAALTGLPRGARAVVWDGRNATGDWAAHLNGASAVVNLCGENLAAGRWSAARKRLLLTSRVEPTQAIVGAIAACRARPAVLVQASGIGVYGSRGEELLSEESAPGEGYLAELCRQWEGAAAPVEALGVRRVVLRTGVVLARSGGALAKMVPPFRWFVGGPFGSGKQWWPWIHEADVVGAIRWLISRPQAAGPFHLAAPQVVRQEEFCAVLGRVLRRPALLRAPAWALQLGLGEMASVLLGSQCAPPSKLLGQGMSFRFPDLEVALRELLRRP
jgi:uncharacterized protein